MGDGCKYTKGANSDVVNPLESSAAIFRTLGLGCIKFNQFASLFSYLIHFAGKGPYKSF
jgi:hypothetical protein